MVEINFNCINSKLRKANVQVSSRTYNEVNRKNSSISNKSNSYNYDYEENQFKVFSIKNFNYKKQLSDVYKKDIKVNFDNFELKKSEFCQTNLIDLNNKSELNKASSINELGNFQNKKIIVNSNSIDDSINSIDSLKKKYKIPSNLFVNSHNKEQCNKHKIFKIHKNVFNPYLPRKLKKECNCVDKVKNLNQKLDSITIFGKNKSTKNNNSNKTRLYNLMSNTKIDIIPLLEETTKKELLILGNSNSYFKSYFKSSDKLKTLSLSVLPSINCGKKYKAPINSKPQKANNKNTLEEHSDKLSNCVNVKKLIIENDNCKNKTSTYSGIFSNNLKSANLKVYVT